jgi:2-haloacid dehalogenase
MAKMRSPRTVCPTSDTLKRMTTTGPATIDAVVFDIGGVLLDWNPRHLYRKLFDDEAAMERFLTEVCTIEWHKAHDLGVPYTITCADLAERHPEHAELIWAWGRRTEEMVAGPIAGTVEILRELRDRSIRCLALTNMEAETYPRRLERYEFLRWFEGTVVSAREGLAKPDPRIFRLLVERFDLRPGTTLMIDDSEANLAAAAALGMHTVHFRSPEHLHEALETLGVLEPPA